uniref:PPPDE domain-containing protein n=1 Tax=Parastrongyloides trichosuri TaxID=131310 RepID=A0A0N4Z0V5_PARTI
MEWVCGPNLESKKDSLNIIVRGLVGRKLFHNLKVSTGKLFFQFTSYNGDNTEHEMYGGATVLYHLNHCCADYISCKKENSYTLDCGYVYLNCLQDVFSSIHDGVPMLGYFSEFYKFTVAASDHYKIVESLGRINF